MPVMKPWPWERYWKVPEWLNVRAKLSPLLRIPLVMVPGGSWVTVKRRVGSVLVQFTVSPTLTVWIIGRQPRKHQLTFKTIGE